MSIHLQGHGIFLRSKAKFVELEGIIWAALRQHSLIKQYPKLRGEGAPDIDALEKRGKELLEEIEAEIHAGLWSTELTPRPTLPTT